MADTKDARKQERVEPVWDQNRVRGDEAPSAGTTGGRRGVSSSDWTVFCAIAVLALAIGVVNGLSAAQDAAWRGGSADLGRRLFWELSSIAVILMTVPMLVLAIRRMRRTPGLAVRAGIGVITLAGFSILHITGMVWMRKFALWLAGSYYDFNLSFATLLYEFRKDAVTCFLLGGVIWLFESRRDLLRLREAVPAGPSALSSSPPDSIWLRDGTSRIRIEPRQILWVASAGNYIEYSLADGTRHLIRGTLAAAESELAR